MYLAGSGGVFTQPAFNDLVARTGWSWGCTALDFDCDGDPDIYVANGHFSGASAKDYCTRFWCHDIYTTGPVPDMVLKELYDSTMDAALKTDTSWDGFQHNNLLMNAGGSAFVNVAFLMGVDYVQDSRCAASEDLNQDGKPDLILTALTPRLKEGMIEESLIIAINRFPEPNNWIGVKLADDSPHCSPIGATVTVRSGGRKQVARVVTGDSYSSQHGMTKHFGLGKAASVESIEIEWADGARQRLEAPAINQYHTVTHDLTATLAGSPASLPSHPHI
jgi:hypothetical protein